jgi:hypothetical protein
MTIDPNLMTRKKAYAENDLRVSTDVLALLDLLRQYVPADKQVLFDRSLYNPQVRRAITSRGKAAFWSDPAAVEQWMSTRPSDLSTDEPA